MIGWMKNLFVGMASYVPVINSFVSKPEDEINKKETTKESGSVIDEFRRIDGLGLSQNLSRRKYNHQTEARTSALKDIVDKFPYNIFQNTPDSKIISSSIKSHIKRIDNSPSSAMNFNETYLIREILAVHNHLTNNFQEDIKKISSEGNVEKTKEKYLAYVKLYIQQSIRLSLETENLILSRLHEDSIQARDSDIAQALTVSKNISKAIMANVMKAYLTHVNGSEVPSAQYSKTVDQLALRDMINSELKPTIKVIHLASQFGIHNQTTVEKFLNHLGNLDFSDDIKLSQSLATLIELQQAIHGSVIQDINDLETPSNSLAEIDSKTIKTCFDQLLKSIVGEFENEYFDNASNEAREIYYYKTRDLYNFLKQIGLKEIEVFMQAKKVAQDEIWRKLNFDPRQEAESINKAYEELNKTAFFLGEIKEPNLPNGGYASPVLEVFRQESAYKRHFKRTIHEVKLLAGIDAISTYREHKSKDLSFEEKHPNFKSLPWLKGFYEESYEKYLTMIDKDMSIEKTVDVAHELSLLGHELHRIGFFASDNFFKRYGIQEYAEKMLEKMGNLTEVGIIAVMIDLYSHLFSYLSPDDKESSFMEVADIGRLKRLIKYLKQLSTIVDPNTGEVLRNPKRPNQHAIDKYHEMARKIGSKGFLLSETDLILDFFTKAIREETKKKLSNKKYSLLDAKHTILATWLLYLLVKFLPKSSEDIKSLKARVKVLKTLLNDRLQPNREIPSTLYPKINRNLMGYKGISDPNNSDKEKERLGIVTEICNEVDSKIKDHIQGRGSSISLKDLLYVYEELEEHLQNNPNGTKKALQEKEKNFNNTKPLLTDLSTICSEALETNPALIVQFAKNSKNPNVKLKLANQILEKLEELIDKLSINHNNELYILDSDQESINNLTKVLVFSQYLGFLLNTNNAKIINLRPEKILVDSTDIEATRIKLERRIQKLNEILNSKVLLEQDERYSETEDAFPDGAQYKAKNSLLDLLSRPGFMIQPSLGKRFQWLKPKQIAKLRDNQVKYSLAA
jgi:hypothetical protein